jgi:hypothetical protein
LLCTCRGEVASLTRGKEAAIRGPYRNAATDFYTGSSRIISYDRAGMLTCPARAKTRPAATGTTSPAVRNPDESPFCYPHRN